MAYNGTITVTSSILVSDRGLAAWVPVPNWTDAEVSFNVDSDTPSTLSVSFDRDPGMPSYAARLKPQLEFSWVDEAGVQQSQTTALGIFVYQPQTHEVSRVGRTVSVECPDLTWVLAADSVNHVYNLDEGDNLVAAAESLIATTGIGHTLPASSAEIGPDGKTWRPGTSKLTIVNDLLTEAGYFTVWATKAGHLTSRSISNQSSREPTHVIDSRDGVVTGTVKLEPDLTRLANEVIVIGNDPGNDPVIASKQNNRPDSPTSTIVLGTKAKPIVISRVIEDTKIKSQSHAEALADRYLEEASAVTERLSLTLTPDGRFRLHEPFSLHIEQDDGTVVATGKWTWDEWTVGFSVANAVMSLRCSKLVPYGVAT